MYGWKISRASKLDLICTESAFIDNTFAGFKSENCIGKTKVDRVISKYSIDKFQDVLCFGDSKGDEELLKLGTKNFYKYFWWKKRNLIAHGYITHFIFSLFVAFTFIRLRTVLYDSEPDYLANALYILQSGYPLNYHHPATFSYYLISGLLLIIKNFTLDLVLPFI